MQNKCTTTCQQPQLRTNHRTRQSADGALTVLVGVQESVDNLNGTHKTCLHGSRVSGVAMDKAV